MARRSEFLNNINANKPSLPQMTIKFFHYTKLVDNKKQYCDEKDEEEIISLAWKIQAVGMVLQPLIVRKIDTDSYEIIGGHKRRRACAYLVEELGLFKYEFVPCLVVNESDVRAEFQIYASNGYHDKTDYEILHELEQMKYLIEEFPEEFPDLPTGRMVDKLAQQLNMKRSTVGEYLQIGKNLSDNAMDKFKKGELTKSAAVAMSSLPETEQNALIKQGVTKHKDIKAYKEEKVEKTVHRTIVTDTLKRTKEQTTTEPTNNLVINSTDFGCDVLVEEPLPGQYSIVNTDMEVIEQYVCPNCRCATSKEKTYMFFNKAYCPSCLEDLLKDLDNTGVISLDFSEQEKKGVVIRF